MALIDTETLSAGAVRVRRSNGSLVVRFFALDGSARVVVEADNEDDARYLCREMGWDFICLCDG
jgi:hypothetical protein